MARERALHIRGAKTFQLHLGFGFFLHERWGLAQEYEAGQRGVNQYSPACSARRPERTLTRSSCHDASRRLRVFWTPPSFGGVEHLSQHGDTAVSQGRALASRPVHETVSRSASKRSDWERFDHSKTARAPG